MPIRFSRAAMRSFCVAFTAISTLSIAAAAAPLPSWPHTDVVQDPALVTGTLPSGMRYEILPNATPKGVVSIRFRIAAGSMQENENQRGLAHFMEHMAFRGSTHFADMGIINTLQRLGLSPGADTNAGTGQNQTVFQFDLPRTDDLTVDTALSVARDIASEATIDPLNAKNESGVVLSELRLRDTPTLRAGAAQLAFMFRDPRAGALPNGNPAIVATAPVDLIRQFYRDYYRPERATLIVVGDIDPAKMEAKIKARFSDWQSVGTGPDDPIISIPVNRGLEASNYSETGLPPSTVMAWIGPHNTAGDTSAEEKRLFTQEVAFVVFNRRLQQASAGEDHPFITASGSRQEFLELAQVTTIGMSHDPDHWREALQAVERIRQQVLQQGVTQGEIDNAVAQLRSRLENEAQGVATQQTPALATMFVRVVGENGVYTNPTQNLVNFDVYTKGLKLAAVNAAFKNAFTGSGPLIFESGPKPVEGGEAAILTAFRQASSAKVAKVVIAPEVKTWPYSNFGTPGKVKETHKADDLDVTYVQFANGVRLTVKPTTFRADQILVSVKVGNGRLDLPSDHRTAIWAATGGALIGGGLTAIDYPNMTRLLSSKIYRATFGLGEDGFILSGETRPADLNIQLQVLAAYTKAPAFRPTVFEQTRNTVLNQLPQLDATPANMMTSRAPGPLHNGDPRWGLPSISEVQNAKLEDLKALLLPILKKGPIDITIVGAVTADQAIKAVAATFGALPARGKPVTVADKKAVKFPPTNSDPFILASTGQEGQGLASIAWPVPGRFTDLKENAALVLIEDYVGGSLVGRLRGAGLTYVANANGVFSKTFDYGYIQAYAEMPPDQTARFYGTVDNIVAELQLYTISNGVLDQIRAPVLANFAKAKLTNEYWLGALDGTALDESKLAIIRDWEANMKAVTPSDILRLSKKYLDKSVAWKLQVTGK